MGHAQHLGGYRPCRLLRLAQDQIGPPRVRGSQDTGQGGCGPDSVEKLLDGKRKGRLAHGGIQTRQDRLCGLRRRVLLSDMVEARLCQRRGHVRRGRNPHIIPKPQERGGLWQKGRKMAAPPVEAIRMRMKYLWSVQQRVAKIPTPQIAAIFPAAMSALQRQTMPDHLGHQHVQIGIARAVAVDRRTQ